MIYNIDSQLINNFGTTRFNSNGDTLWTENLEARKFIETPDGILYGVSSLNNQITLFSYDPFGNPINNNSYSLGNSSEGTNIITTLDNHLLLTGYTKNPGEPESVLVVKTDGTFDVFSHLLGRTSIDDNTDCIPDTSSSNALRLLVKIENSTTTRYAYTDSLGNF